MSEDKDNDKKFSPHYIFTILDDSYLSGHGLNEYLAEDMTKYGVTVIWCKESQAFYYTGEFWTTRMDYNDRTISLWDLEIPHPRNIHEAIELFDNFIPPVD